MILKRKLKKQNFGNLWKIMEFWGKCGPPKAPTQSRADGAT
jgi:hypothetical protein